MYLTKPDLTYPPDLRQGGARMKHQPRLTWAQNHGQTGATMYPNWTTEDRTGGAAHSRAGAEHLRVARALRTSARLAPKTCLAYLSGPASPPKRLARNLPQPDSSNTQLCQGWCLLSLPGLLLLGGLYLSIYLSIYQKALVAPNNKGRATQVSKLTRLTPNGC